MNRHGLIPISEWRWFGMPGHFIASDSCCFHMVTVVGQLKISTIGCYHKTGDPKDYDHRSQIGAGAESLYETFVFRIKDEPQVEGESVQPEIEPLEIDGEGWATEPEAEAGHIEYCRKWSDWDLQARELAAHYESITGQETE